MMTEDGISRLNALAAEKDGEQVSHQSIIAKGFTGGRFVVIPCSMDSSDLAQPNTRQRITRREP